MVGIIERYAEIVGERVVMELLKKVRKLKRRNILNINSTFLGGGVAEILYSLMPVFNEFGMGCEWRVLHGTLPFYNISKKIHNGLQGEDVRIDLIEKRLYEDINAAYGNYTRFNQNCVIIHDPQPLPLVGFIDSLIPIIWRCHIDLSNPNGKLWEYLKQYIRLCSLVVVSREEYKKKDLLVEQRVISPAIDPLSDKNKYLDQEQIGLYLTRANIPMDKPIISQISRMDKWKDPEGLLEIYGLVRKKVDCRLLYCYNSATDDPEGEMILNKIKEKANDLIDRGDVLLVIGDDPFLVNAIQTYSSVVVQKSIKEGFCLAVTEALWKETPVVASRVGGIPSQIINDQTGFLVEPDDYQGFADRIDFLIKKKIFADGMVRKAKEFVRENFLLTRLLGDYLNLFEELL